MTAHAMQGDREKCLEAGMDIYITKPIDQRILFEAVESALIESSNPADKPLDMKTTASPTAFDPAIVLQRVDGDQELLKEVITLFLEDTPGLLAEIRLAAARGDGEALERASHTLKGSVGNFGARAAQELALALELMGRQRDFARAADTAARLDGEVKRLLPALETWLKEKAA
jgi:HPt (histidine-containing phosphotransfer) domain-containing protein